MQNWLRVWIVVAGLSLVGCSSDSIIEGKDNAVWKAIEYAPVEIMKTNQCVDSTRLVKVMNAHPMVDEFKKIAFDLAGNADRCIFIQTVDVFSDYYKNLFGGSCEDEGFTILNTMDESRWEDYIVYRAFLVFEEDRRIGFISSYQLVLPDYPEFSLTGRTNGIEVGIAYRPEYIYDVIEDKQKASVGLKFDHIKNQFEQVFQRSKVHHGKTAFFRSEDCSSIDTYSMADHNGVWYYGGVGADIFSLEFQNSLSEPNAKGEEADIEKEIMLLWEAIRQYVGAVRIINP